MTKTGRLLLVEDETLILLNLNSTLNDRGWEVAYLAAKGGSAIGIARTGSCADAVIDSNVDGSMTYPGADILKARAIPVAFTTGYGKNGIDNAYSKVPILPKPFSRDQLETLLNGLLPR